MNLHRDQPSSRQFTHEAMNTTFRLCIINPDSKLASSIAREAFEELDRLEGKLSRYIEDSEISRINRLQQGEALNLSPECHRCLLLALELHLQSGGLFDVTLGRAIEHRKSSKDELPVLSGALSIHPDQPAVTCLETGREIDLGGIGKGYALDHLGAILKDWGAEGLLSAGNSTHLALGSTPWPVELSAEREPFAITLKNEAVSASGISIQGSHIIHPHAVDAPYEPTWQRLWLIGTTATEADAWSTAAMLMSREEHRQVISEQPSIRKIFVEIDGVPTC